MMRVILDEPAPSARLMLLEMLLTGAAVFAFALVTEADEAELLIALEVFAFSTVSSNWLVAPVAAG